MLPERRDLVQVDGNSEACMISKPSASDCIIPYSIPLWTIFTKWPAPDGADVRVAARLGQVLEERLDLLVGASASPPTITQ